MINQNIKDDGLSKEFGIIGFGGSGIAAAIELSKKMAYDTAPKFINALLDKINKIT